MLCSLHYHPILGFPSSNFAAKLRIIWPFVIIKPAFLAIIHEPKIDPFSAFASRERARDAKLAHAELFTGLDYKAVNRFGEFFPDVAYLF